MRTPEGCATASELQDTSCTLGMAHHLVLVQTYIGPCAQPVAPPLVAVVFRRGQTLVHLTAWCPLRPLILRTCAHPSTYCAGGPPVPLLTLSEYPSVVVQT